MGQPQAQVLYSCPNKHHPFFCSRLCLHSHCSAQQPTRHQLLLKFIHLSALWQSHIHSLNCPCFSFSAFSWKDENSWLRISEGGCSVQLLLEGRGYVQER